MKRFEGHATLLVPENPVAPAPSGELSPFLPPDDAASVLDLDLVRRRRRWRRQVLIAIYGACGGSTMNQVTRQDVLDLEGLGPEDLDNILTYWLDLGCLEDMTPSPDALAEEERHLLEAAGGCVLRLTAQGIDRAERWAVRQSVPRPRENRTGAGAAPTLGWRPTGGRQVS